MERGIRGEFSFSEQHGNKAALYHSVSEYVVAGLNLVHLSTEGDTFKKNCFKLIDVQNYGTLQTAYCALPLTGT